MLCDRYKEALTQAAASGLRWPADAGGLSTAVREHLKSCGRCQEFLAREQNLFASIDEALRQSVNPELPHFFLARANERLARVSQSNTRRRPAFAFAAVLLVVSFAVATHYRQSRTSQPRLQGPEIALQNIGNPEKQALSRKYSPPLTGTNTHETRVSSHADRVVEQPEVLVPPDERQAFEQFVADSQADQSFMTAFLTATKEPFVWDKNPPVQVQPLEVRRLEVTALDPQVETRTDPGNSR